LSVEFNFCRAIDGDLTNTRFLGSNRQSPSITGCRWRWNWRKSDHRAAYQPLGRLLRSNRGCRNAWPGRDQLV